MSRPAFSWRMAGRSLELGSRTVIMGVINVTPDSFSDGGDFLDASQAIEQGLSLFEQGALILDVGGESTRPGSDPVSEARELERVIPVIEGLAENPEIIISIDTTKARVAKEAVAAGAHIINDVSALGFDGEMASTAAETGAGLILMHMLEKPRTMQKKPSYDDVSREVGEYLAGRAEMAVKAGVSREAIVLDPGIGFGKLLEHNLTLIKKLSELGGLGYPVLLGASRKSLIGQVTGKEDPKDRLWGTMGVHVLGAALGAHIVRVHDAAPMKDALLMVDAVMEAGEDT